MNIYDKGHDYISSTLNRPVKKQQKKSKLLPPHDQREYVLLDIIEPL